MTTDSKGNPLSAYQSINDMQILLDIEVLEPVKGKVKIYDYNLKQDVEIQKYIFPELVGQEIGCVFAMVSNPKYKNGELSPTFKQFFHPDTIQSASEYLNDEEPKQIDRYVNLLLEDKHIIKQATNQPNAPVNDAVPMDDDMYDDNIF
jgi:hypothetical protein